MLKRDRELLDVNRRFYDLLWSGARLVEPSRFNTWPLVSSLLPRSQRQLEVAPGLRPRLPIAATQFVDISVPALSALRARGASVMLGLVSSLPFAVARVAAPGAVLLLSAPLHPSRWTAFDDFVGHRRRYEPQELIVKLAHHGLSVEHSGAYGMQPRSSRLLDFGIWWLTHHRERAMWWYNRALMPLGVRLQKKLMLAPGMIDAAAVDEVLLVCRKQGASPAALLH